MGWTIVTGATGSMGRVAAESLAREGRPVILACRNLVKGQDAVDGIRKAVPSAELKLMELNLESLAAVRQFAASLEGMTIDGLFNNAGTMERRYSKTADGLEKTVAVNVAGTALLTTLIAPMMPDGGRIVNMVSLSSKYERMNWNWKDVTAEHFNQLGTYALSKKVLLDWSYAFAKYNPRLIVNVSDPGIVNSKMLRMDRWYDPLADIFFRPFTHKPETGVAPALRALHAERSFGYYVGKRTRPMRDSGRTERVWKQVEELL